MRTTELDNIILKNPELSPDTETALFMLNLPSEELAEVLFKSNLKYFIKFSNRYSSWVNQDEGLSMCYDAVVNALKTFNPDHENGTSFLGWCIFYLKNTFNQRIRKMQKISKNEIFDTFVVGDNEISLFDNVAVDNMDLGDLLGDLGEYRRHLSDAMDRLSLKNKKYIQAYFIDGLLLREISEEYGVTKQCIQIMMQGSLKKLKTVLIELSDIEDQKSAGIYNYKSKICTKCGVDKELREYHKKKSNHDGLAYQCKTCCNLANQVLRDSKKGE